MMSSTYSGLKALEVSEYHPLPPGSLTISLSKWIWKSWSRSIDDHGLVKSDIRSTGMKCGSCEYLGRSKEEGLHMFGYAVK